MHKLLLGKRPLIILSGLLIVSSIGYYFSAKLFHRRVSYKPPILSDPPKPTTIATGTPQEQAAAFADIVASSDRNKRLAGWLGVYDAMGVPVLAQNGIPIGSTGDDPIGPRFWQLWYASGRDLPGRGIRITDVGKLIAVGPQEDGKDLGTILFKDLKQALQSSDAKVRFLGEFVRERVRRGSSHVDLLNPEVTPDSAVIDLPTVQLLGWIGMRGALFRSIASSQRSPSGYGEYQIRTVAETTLNLGPAAPQAPCAEQLGSSDTTYWVNWFLREIAARGVQLPGMEKELPGWIERAQRWIGKARGADDLFYDDLVKKTKAVGAWMNAFTAILSFATQIASLDISGVQEPDPLVRTKDTRDGREGRIILALSVFPDQKADETISECSRSFLVNALGLSMTLPPNGRVAGAEVRLYGLAGFPDLVLFANYRDAFPKDTNANGEVTFGIIGKAQKRQVPDSAKPVDKEFSVYVTAQPEAADGNTIANIFFQGLMFGAGPSAAGPITPFIDILKTFHWRLGEYVFRVKDWKTPGYRVLERYNLGDTGIICSFEKPFKIVSTIPGGEQQMVIHFRPSSSHGGSADYHLRIGAASVLSATGPYTVEEIEDADNLVGTSAVIRWNGTNTLTTVAEGRVFTQVGTWTPDYYLGRLDTDECKDQ